MCPLKVYINCNVEIRLEINYNVGENISWEPFNSSENKFECQN